MIHLVWALVCLCLLMFSIPVGFVIGAKSAARGMCDRLKKVKRPLTAEEDAIVKYMLGVQEYK